MGKVTHIVEEHRNLAPIVFRRDEATRLHNLQRCALRHELTHSLNEVRQRFLEGRKRTFIIKGDGRNEARLAHWVFLSFPSGTCEEVYTTYVICQVFHCNVCSVCYHAFMQKNLKG